MKRPSFEKLVKRVLAGLPAEYADRLENLVFLIEEWADAETLAAVGFEAPEELLGYYDGVPLTERTFEQISFGPDRIYLYRGAIEEEARVTGLPLLRVIRETVWHEVAHYFGFSEDEMDRIESLWAGDE